MGRRIIVKLSGEALAGGRKDLSFDYRHAGELTNQIKDIMQIRNLGLSLVIGGGNIMRGAAHSDHIGRVKADQIGMLATLQNALYMQGSLQSVGVPAVTMTPASLCQPRNEKPTLCNCGTFAALP